ncbi:DUF3515 domain-containing protein [Cellulomonas fimi]|uniref:DUF3515 family protein n=1 Tax=Cellulomonas fimi TaxID=1708 RepID=UPI00234DDD67|nr:DUF3515 family protein [Cellulomonas fimi]MDC7121150.1 DUF3515 domain-containing protein [Cellulomonas fimi]
MPSTRSRLRAGVSVVALLALGGCAQAVPVTVAPHATDPVCADVVLSTPDTLGDDLERVDTTSQATTAWGDPHAAVVLRCGVEPLGPTTDRCVTVEAPDGTSVDWVVVADDPADEQGSDWTFTTYGRVPAVEVRVPAEVAATTSSTSFVDVLGPAVAQAAVERSCVGLTG